MEEMKMKLCIALAGFFMASFSAFGAILFQDDFSDASLPTWYRHTVNPSDFDDTWSVTSRLETVLGNPCACFDIAIPTLTTNPIERWDAGLSATLLPDSILPYAWELTFDLYIETSEPVRISMAQTGLVPSVPFAEQRLTYWVTPPEAGWQQITVNSEDEAIISYAMGSPDETNRSCALRIGLSSHDLAGLPLSISEIGNYTFKIDNLMLRSSDAPYVAVKTWPTGDLSLFFSGNLQSSGDLNAWTTLDPQPSSPCVLPFNMEKEFFRVFTE